MEKDIFNVKIIRYDDFDEIHIYDKPVISHDNRLVDNDGVITEKQIENRGLTYNPFTEQYEKLTNLDNLDINAYKSSRRAKDKIYKLALHNKPWEYFVTFTLDSKKVDRYDYCKCSRVVSQWLQNIKKRKCPDMKYLVVPEQHKDGAWHFHGLFANIDGLHLVDSLYRDSQGRIIYNCDDYKLGFTTLTKITDVDKAVSYILKYVSKELFKTIGNKKRYWYSRTTMSMPEELNLIWDCSYIDKLQSLSEHIQHIYSVDNMYNKADYIILNKKLDDIKLLGEFYTM